MVWLTRPSSLPASNQRGSYRQSIELPVAFTVRGLPAPVYGTLINISESGCRLRSLILIDRDRLVEFTLQRAGVEPLTLSGRVKSRSTPTGGAGFEYGLSFDDLSQQQRPALARELAELQRRAAAGRAHARETAKESSETDQRRRSVRTMISFAVRYRPMNRSAANGEANDVSVGGLRLHCTDALAVGSELELRFTLPDKVLAAYPKPGERVEITPFGERRVRLPDNRRPFEEMLVHGRVLSRFDSESGNPVYGVAFTDIDGYQREEIARFTHAVQLYRLRSSN